MGIPYTPAPFTEPDVFLSVRLVRGEADRQFERLSGAPWQVQEWQEAVSLAVIVASSPTFHQRSPPMRHGGVGGPGIGPSRWPRVYEHRRRRIVPADPTVWKSCSRSAHRLADCDVQVVPRHSQMPRGHPDLRQARVDIHERRPPEAPHQRGRDVVRQVQQQVRLVRRLEAQAARRRTFRQPFAGSGAQCHGVRQVVAVQPCLQDREVAPDVLPGGARRNRLDPGHPAA